MLPGEKPRCYSVYIDDRDAVWLTDFAANAIVRFDPDGKNVVVADRVDGKKLNTPNDLAVDRKGRIWFTDPLFGIAVTVTTVPVV